MKFFNKFYDTFTSPNYTELDAINGCQVDQLNYSIRLIQQGDNTSLISAYVWLSLASEHVGIQQEAKRIMHQLSYTLKCKEIYELALEKEKIIRTLYSPEARLQQWKQSWNPLDIIAYRSIVFMNKLISFGEFLNARIFKEKITSFQYISIMVFSAMPALLMLIYSTKSIASLIIISVALIISMIAGLIYEIREDKNK